MVKPRTNWGTTYEPVTKSFPAITTDHSQEFSKTEDFLAQLYYNHGYHTVLISRKRAYFEEQILGNDICAYF